MIKVKYTINEEVWTIRVLSKRSFKRIHYDVPGATGVMQQSIRYIDLLETELCKNNLLHELLHANMSYLHLHDVNKISHADYEEIYVNFFVGNHKKILKQFRDIWKEIQLNVRRAKEKRRGDTTEGGSEVRPEETKNGSNPG